MFIKTSSKIILNESFLNLGFSDRSVANEAKLRPKLEVVQSNTDSGKQVTASNDSSLNKDSTANKSERGFDVEFKIKIANNWMINEKYYNLIIFLCSVILPVQSPELQNFIMLLLFWNAFTVSQKIREFNTRFSLSLTNLLKLVIHLIFAPFTHSNFVVLPIY